MRGVLSGKRDSNCFLEAFNYQHITGTRKDTRCKIGETFAAFQDVFESDLYGHPTSVKTTSMDLSRLSSALQRDLSSVKNREILTLVQGRVKIKRCDNCSEFGKPR